MKLHLAIDAVGARFGGAAVVLLGVLEAAREHPGVGRVTLFSSPPDERRFEIPGWDAIVDRPQPGPSANRGRRIQWNVSGSGKAASLAGADVLLALAGMGASQGKTRCALYVQQSLPFSWEALRTTSPQNWLRIGVMRAMMLQAVHRSSSVIVQTASMQHRVSAAFGLDPGRVQVFMPPPRKLICSGETPPAVRAMESGEPALLFVGNQSPYKNVSLLVDAFSQLKVEMPAAKLYLTWPQEHPVSQVDGVTCLGYLDEGALAHAYRLASALVHPSLVESFGLPLFEAMRLGTPVVAADRPYAHDVAGAAALFFDPSDPVSLTGALRRLLTQPGLANHLVEHGHRRVAEVEANDGYLAMVDWLVASYC